MHLWQAAVLGVVQGLTEFLPISSTAHVEIARSFLHYPSQEMGAAFTAVIQLGTLAAVLIYFRSDLFRAFGGWVKSFKGGRQDEASRLGWAVFVGTLPIVALGLAFQKSIESNLRTPTVIAWALILVAVVMFVAERVSPLRRAIASATVVDGLVMGMCQACALIPGVSRSGSTISGALFCGFDREAAARFSFLLSIPAVLLAGVFEFFKYRHQIVTAGFAEIAAATAAAFVVGYLSIDFLLKFLRKNSLIPFIVYRVIIGILILTVLRGQL